MASVPPTHKTAVLQHRPASQNTPVQSGTIIITGGAGFIGSAIVWMLNRHRITDIIVVDQLGHDPVKWQNLRGLQFADIWTPSHLLDQIRHDTLSQVTTVIHMGACSATTETDADHLLENNYRYSRILGQWAIDNKKRFLYASSAAIYGDGHLGFSDDPDLLPRLRPLNMYGYSKQLFDLHVMRAGWNNHCIGLRYFNIFGPNEYHKGSMRSMAYHGVQQARQKGEIALFKTTDSRFGHGEQLRDFLYIKDTVDLVWQLLNRTDINGIYNIGSGSTSSWNQLAHAVFAAMELPTKIRYIDMPAELVQRYQSYTCADLSALNTALGNPFTPQPFPNAIHDYVTNYLSTPNPKHLEN